MSFANGIMQKLKNRKVVKSVEIVKPSEQQDGNSDTMTKIVNDEIVVAVYGGVLILNDELETVKHFNGIVEWSTCIDGNAEYIAVGYNKGQVCFYNKSCDTSPTVSELKQNKLTQIETGLQTRGSGQFGRRQWCAIGQRI